MARQPGEVRDAILAALKEAGEPMKVSEIYGAVEARLGGPVARSSVRSYLQGGRGIRALGRGKYRYVGDPSAHI
jgi:hypothetical protein